ncbi:hypothetical protein QJS10_CPA02g00828 [Acorus calamus]|uniref:Uncharacterized protein n=1 Tax=Acorus calamus TaxID=4465 RepID=A0AAV9FE51_ACOCL|nr:hypothetical protein QJS10_CPA02g00828 [Acorus calamus]
MADGACDSKGEGWRWTERRKRGAAEVKNIGKIKTYLKRCRLEYIGKRPVIIPYHRGGKKLHIGFQEFKEDMPSHSQAIVNNLNNVRPAKKKGPYVSRIRTFEEEVKNRLHFS